MQCFLLLKNLKFLKEAHAWYILPEVHIAICYIAQVRLVTLPEKCHIAFLKSAYTILSATPY